MELKEDSFTQFNQINADLETKIKSLVIFFNDFIYFNDFIENNCKFSIKESTNRELIKDKNDLLHINSTFQTKLVNEQKKCNDAMNLSQDCLEKIRKNVSFVLSIATHSFVINLI